MRCSILKLRTSKIIVVRAPHGPEAVQCGGGAPDHGYYLPATSLPVGLSRVVRWKRVRFLKVHVSTPPVEKLYASILDDGKYCFCFNVPFWFFGSFAIKSILSFYWIIWLGVPWFSFRGCFKCRVNIFT